MEISENPPWAYKSRSNDPSTIKSAFWEMTDSISKVAGVDSVICPFASYVHSIGDGSAAETSENKLTVDFTNRQIQLPKLTISSVEDRLIRYAAFIVPPDYDTGSKNMHVVALSTWQQQNKDIQNIYLVLNLSDALLMMNAVSRLISTQGQTRAHQFYPLVTGRVFVSNCNSSRHTVNNADCCDTQKLMFFILDPESLSFFEHSFSNKPTYDFRFYKEKGPRAIDIIYVSKDLSNIHLSQETQICIIRKNLNSETDTEAYDMLLKLLKQNVIKPQPEEYFTSGPRYDGYGGSGVGGPSRIYENREMRRMPVVTNRRQLESRYQEPRYQESEWQRTDEQYGVEPWMNDLYTGHHVDRNLDETLQLMWCTVEHDLRECIESNAVPYSAFESGGLDPNAPSHLQRSVEDIKDHLLNNDMALALSRLEACLNVFKETLLQRVSHLDKVTLMKRIYFLSGTD